MSDKLKRFIFYGIFFGQLAGIFLVWLSNATPMINSGGPAALIAYGSLWGLTAGFFFLNQSILISGSALFEKYFGLDRLARIHHVNGFVGYFFLVAHVLFVAFGYGGLSNRGFPEQMLAFSQEFPYVLWASIALILFDIVIITSALIVIRKLRYELWYYVHLLVYAAVLLGVLHQVTNGQNLATNAWFRTYWVGLYIIAFVLVLRKRWFLPRWLQRKHNLTVERIEEEAKGVTSVYVTGDKLEEFHYQAGQFGLWKFVDPNIRGMHHPFTFSSSPREPFLRLSAKAIGDFTTKLPQLTVGSPVRLNGPYGRFTANVTSNQKRLFIAGGIGVTPIRSMLADKIVPGDVLVYAARTKADLAFYDEFESMKNQGLTVFYVLSDQELPGVQHGYVSQEILERVDDLISRDVWLCGPPAMMKATEILLNEAGLPKSQLHTEKFRL